MWKKVQNRAQLPPERLRSLLVLTVLLDLTGAALVVPLLPVRLQLLGVSQRANGVLSAVYSLAQVIGGLLLGALSDRCLGRRGLLLLSFAGAGISYSLFLGMFDVDLKIVVLARLIVGMTKQTMTASVAMMAEITSEGTERTYWISRISSAAMLALICGQALGGFLSRFGNRVPIGLGVALYVIDTVIIRLAFDPNIGWRPGCTQRSPAAPDTQKHKFMQALSSIACTKVVAVNLINQFVLCAVGSSRVLYELERWHLTIQDIGWLASYKSLIGILSSWLVADTLTRRFGTWTLVYGATCASAAAYFLESVPGEAFLPEILGAGGGGSLCSFFMTLLPAKFAADPSFLVFVCACLPVHTVATQTTMVALKSRFTEIVPKSEIASALAALDVLQSMVGVLAPVAGGLLFHGIIPTCIPQRCAVLELVLIGSLLLLCPPLAANQAYKTEK